MRYITNCALQVKGDRVEKGEEIELSEEEVAAIDPADIVAVDTIPQEDPEPAAPEVPIAEMSLAELKARAKDLGLKTSGSKADIEERIRLHLDGTGEEELSDDN